MKPSSFKRIAKACASCKRLEKNIALRKFRCVKYDFELPVRHLNELDRYVCDGCEPWDMPELPNASD